MKEKTIISIISFVFLLIYINFTIVFILVFYDFLPSIINTISLYFIFPMGIAGFLGIVGAKISNKITNIKGNPADHILFKTLLIISLLVWLIVIICSFTGIKQYIQLKTFRKHLKTNIQNINHEQADKSGFITITDAKALFENYGFFHEKRTSKSVDKTTITFYDYYAVPVTNFVDNQEIKVFICDNVSYNKDAAKHRKEKPEFIGKHKENICGIIIRERGELNSYKKAIKNAEKKYNIKLSENVLLMEHTDSFENTMNKYQNRTVLYFIIVNLLFVFLPVFFIHKNMISD